MTEEQTNQIIPDFIEYFYEIDVDFKRPNKPEMFKFLKIYKKKTEIKKEEEPKTPRDKIIKIESNIPKVESEKDSFKISDFKDEDKLEKYINFLKAHKNKPITDILKVKRNDQWHNVEIQK